MAGSAIRFQPKSGFGRHLGRKQIPVAVAAKALGITRVHAWMLASGRSRPSLRLAGKIEKWSGGRVRAVRWKP